MGNALKTKVVHVSRSPYDVYIGRGPDPKTGIPGKWGCPFVIGKDGTRSEVIQKYREWIVTQPDLMESIKEMQGLRLGCWCGNKLCHGFILADLADKLEKEPDLYSIFD
jgi:hypothetical protein